MTGLNGPMGNFQCSNWSGPGRKGNSSHAQTSAANTSIVQHRVSSSSLAMNLFPQEMDTSGVRVRATTALDLAAVEPAHAILLDRQPSPGSAHMLCTARQRSNLRILLHDEQSRLAAPHRLTEASRQTHGPAIQSHAAWQATWPCHHSQRTHNQRTLPSLPHPG